MLNEEEFKEKARQHIFNCRLKDFPVVFLMYIRSFNLTVDFDEASAKIIYIIRTSENNEVAYAMVCHYLDSLE